VRLCNPYNSQETASLLHKWPFAFWSKQQVAGAETLLHMKNSICAIAVMCHCHFGNYKNYRRITNKYNCFLYLSFFKKTLKINN